MAQDQVLVEEELVQAMVEGLARVVEGVVPVS
jgi:hypothetical protein